MSRHQRESIRKQYKLDDKFVRQVEAEIEKIDREALLPDPKDLEIADLRAQLARLNAVVDKQADLQEKTLAEVDRLEAENAKFEEKWLAAEDALAEAKKDLGNAIETCGDVKAVLQENQDLWRRIKSFESIARSVVSDTESAA